MHFVPAKFQTQFIVVGRREMVSTIMDLTNLRLGFSDFEALEPILLVCPQTCYSLEEKPCISISWAGRLQHFLFSFENGTFEIYKLKNPYFQWTHSGLALAFSGHICHIFLHSYHQGSSPEMHSRLQKSRQTANCIQRKEAGEKVTL